MLKLRPKRMVLTYWLAKQSISGTWISADCISLPSVAFARCCAPEGGRRRTAGADRFALNFFPCGPEVMSGVRNMTCFLRDVADSEDDYDISEDDSKRISDDSDEDRREVPGRTPQEVPWIVREVRFGRSSEWGRAGPFDSAWLLLCYKFLTNTPETRPHTFCDKHVLNGPAWILNDPFRCTP